jgi:hypothetical protein
LCVIEKVSITAHVVFKVKLYLIYCEITFIRGIPIFVVFVGRLIHEIKNPTNNETWEAV